MDAHTIIHRLLGTGLTQAEIAELADIAQSTVSSYANQKRGVVSPSWRVMDGLKRLLNERLETINQDAA